MTDIEATKTESAPLFRATQAPPQDGVASPPWHGQTRVTRSTSNVGLGRWAMEIVRRRELLFILAWREIRVKYKQSVMGFMWAILMPTIIVGAGVFVKFAFASLTGAPMKNADIASVAARSVPWAFFVSTIRFASASLIGNANLVTKIYMPRAIFPLSSVVSQLIDLAVAASVLALLLVFTGGVASLRLLWLPVLFAVLLLQVTGLSIFLSAAALFFRDVKYIVEVIITFAIFFTPVFYDVSMFGRWSRVLLLNPVAPILEGISAVVLGRPLPYVSWLLYSAVVGVVALAGSLLFFKRTEPYFAESV
jgi:ABC-type polysaccharide/polyol phosphate export permease